MINKTNKSLSTAQENTEKFKWLILHEWGIKGDIIGLSEMKETNTINKYITYEINQVKCTDSYKDELFVTHWMFVSPANPYAEISTPWHTN